MPQTLFASHVQRIGQEFKWDPKAIWESLELRKALNPGSPMVETTAAALSHAHHMDAYRRWDDRKDREERRAIMEAA